MLVFQKHDAVIGGEFTQAPMPHIKGDEVLIQVLYTSICGTDFHIYSWDAWSAGRVKPPTIMGHEFVGQIIEVGHENTTHQIGDIVVAETHIICNTCEHCLNNHGHICKNTKVIGVDTDGCFAQYIALPAQNALIMNDIDLPLEQLSMLEPLGNAVHTINSTDVKDKIVVINGCGPIGLMAIDVAKANKAKKVVAIDINPYRLDLAFKLGADLILDASTEDVVEKLMTYTDGYGVDVVAEMSGHPQAIAKAFKFLKDGGHMAMLGVASQPLLIDISKDIVFKGITIAGITGRRMFETWDQIRGYLLRKELHLDIIHTHTLPFVSLELGMEYMASGDCGKVVLKVSDRA